MQFYPHNVSSTTIGSAISASTATSASFINNFAGIAIYTASIALNITGSAGASGTSVALIGPTGSQGARGVTGFRGNSIFLLSSSWSGSACGNADPCNGPITLYNTGPSLDECRNDQGSADYYTTSSLNRLSSPTVGDANGVILYTNGVCSSVAASISPAVSNLSVVFYTDGAGVITSTGCNA